MGQISIGTPIDTSLIRCCSCRKGYNIKGNVYENNVLVCPYCGLRHKIDFTLIDKKIDNLIKIDRLNLTDIDIGSAAIDRADGWNITYTTIASYNPANASGTITSVEIWSQNTISNCEVATFYNVSGNNFSTRDTEVIGTVLSGAKRTFNVNLTVEAGDYIGIYGTEGLIEISSGGDFNVWYLSGDHIPCTNVTFTFYNYRQLSLYGTGTTAAADFTYTGTGSFTYSGVAAQAYTTDFLYTGSGSLTFSGEGSYGVFNYEYTGSGELAYSGSAITTIGFVHVASGDFTLSGVGTYSYFTKYSCVGSGTYSFSGVGTYIPGFISVGSGVLVYSGDADFPATRPANIYYLVSKVTTIYYEKTIPTLTSCVVSTPSTVYYEVSL